MSLNLPHPYRGMTLEREHMQLLLLQARERNKQHVPMASD